MSDTILTLQRKSGSNRKYDEYLRIEFNHDDPHGALDQLLAEPDAFALGLQPLTATGGRRKRKVAGRAEPEMPGT